MKYVNLHTHSHYSLLDGLPKIPDLVKRAKELEMPALALTDHGVMYGIVEFFKECQKANIKPILGFEAYLALKHRASKQSKIDDSFFHLTLIAQNTKGYKNLMKLVSIGHTEGFYYKPRIDKESLRYYSEGIIALTGCLAGEIPRAIVAENSLEKPKAILEEYIDIFGQDNVFLEIQHHPEIREQIKVNDALAELSQTVGIPRVATLDCHYLNSEDSEAQDALVCVQSGKMVEDTERLDMRDVDLSMRSPKEMYEIFANDTDVLEQSVKIAERCDAEIEMDQRYFPSYEIPKEKTPEQVLREKTFNGLEKRYQNKEITDEVKERVEYELKVINDQGFATYFLVVADLVNWMNNQGIVTTTRGSAAGCMVSYCLGITNIDPIEYELPFERFLNPYRPSPPDIDLDIADDSRDKVIAHVTEKYGKDKVAQIITFGTMLARAAVRDIGRVLGISYAKCDQIAKLVPPPKQGFPMSIDKAMQTVPELQEQYNTDPETRKIIDLARKVEGVARHSSVHAAGVVISPDELTNYTPVQLDVDKNGMVTQYDMHACEDVGLVKMDFLGLRNLAILGNAVEIIRAKHNVEIDLNNLPLDDQKTYDLLARGETVGIFQLSSSGMTAYVKELRPTTIFDIAAMIALYRPGPMAIIPEYIARKHGKSGVKFMHPKMEKFLDKSFGLLVYQEDIMFTALELAGYTWATVDKLRKAVGKKIPAEMAKQHDIFVKGCQEHSNMSAQEAEKLWQLFEPFQGYGFNKAHAASYASVAYQTAYLKAHYPAEFMAALLTAESHDLDKIAVAVEECKKMDIAVLPPDVNESYKMFAVIDNKTIRWSLNAIKNVGHDVVAAIVSERKENGPYVSFADFVNRMPNKSLNRKSLESLICCGAFDSFGERNSLLQNLEDVLTAVRSARRNKVEGQKSLFTTSSSAKISNPLSSYAYKQVEPATENQVLAWEKELLGLYITSHPLEQVQDILNNLHKISSIHGAAENSEVIFGGIVSSLKKITTRKGEPMAFITFEDLTGNIECVCFPRNYTQSRELLESNSKLLIKGKVSEKDDETKVLIDEILELTKENAQGLQGKTLKASRKKTSSAYNALDKIKIKIPKSANVDLLNELKLVLQKYPGQTQVVLVVPNGIEDKNISTNYKINVAEDLKKEIKELLKNGH